MPAFRRHDPDEVAHAKTLYEQTDISPKDIARILGIGVNTFYRRVKRWGWRRRRLRIEEVEAVALKACRSRDAALAAMGRDVLDDRRSAVERAEAAVISHFDALTMTQERVALAALTVLDGERAGRALRQMARALVEIGKLKETKPREQEDEYTEEEVAEMRAALRKRGEQLVAEHRGDAGQGGDAAGTQAAPSRLSR